MLTDRTVDHVGAGVWAILALAGVVLLGGGPAFAGVGLGVTPTFPAAEKAGQTSLSGNITISYGNTSPDDADTDTVSSILLTPSCGTSITAGVPDLATCPAAQIDAGVFTIHTPATGTGGCAGVVFAVGPPPGPPDPSGKLLFDPSPSTVTLGPASAACIIHFTFDVVQKPTKDADVSNGLQTAALAAASAQSNFGVPGGGNGSAIISFPTIATTQTPASGTRGATTLTDSAALTGLVNERSTVNTDPTGTVTFTLFDPDQPTCGGSPRHTFAVNLTGCATKTKTTFTTGFSGCADTVGFVPDKSGTWNWVATWAGDASNASVSPLATSCGDEAVSISQPVLAIQKTPDGATINAGDTATFTIVVSNLGPGTATSVTLTDPLPDPNGGLNWSTGTAGCSVSGSSPSQTLSCSFGDLAASASRTVTVSTPTTTASCADYRNFISLGKGATASATNAASVTDDGEIICQGPRTTTLTTVPRPRTGTVNVTRLNDSAQVTGGTGLFTGTITFRLFDPNQTGCSGTPRFQQDVAVSSGGSASTSGGFVADKPGNWRWTAHYSGDAQNNAADSVCGAEVVVITGGAVIPTLSEWGMVLLVTLLVGIGCLTLSRRRNLTAG